MKKFSIALTMGTLLAATAVSVTAQTYYPEPPVWVACHKATADNPFATLWERSGSSNSEVRTLEQTCVRQGGVPFTHWT